MGRSDGAAFWVEAAVGGTPEEVVVVLDFPLEFRADQGLNHSALMCL
jgi:hypothetical protein